MKENKYDDAAFFQQYSQMPRSVLGLQGAGEWHALKKLLPDFQGKRVLDLGCGFGWHCRYAAEGGAGQVVGIDLSRRMLQQAQERNHAPNITYRRMSMEEYEYPAGEFDVVISSLAFHYVEDFASLISFFPWSIRCLPRMAPRSGTVTGRASPCTGRWTGTLRKGSVPRVFWGKGWSNTIGR